MSVRVAINGFGRIGRLVLRALAESDRSDITVVAINDPAPAATAAHLLTFDSVHGPLRLPVTLEGDRLTLGRRPAITLLSETDPAALPWEALDIDVVLECTGRFTSRDKAAAHLSAGAKRVLVSAPCEKADITVVQGVNASQLTGDHLVVSNASCTTNCLAPVAMVLNAALGIETGMVTTVHAYTGGQALVDSALPDLQRARAAGLSMIPTSTGAARAVGLVLPELAGRLDGVSIRVPTPNVSAVDLKMVMGRATTAEEINGFLKTASEGPLAGILGYNTLPLVSVDFTHDSHSGVFDATETKVMNGTFARVLIWYDNEWGFSNRMLDTARDMGRLI